MSLRIAGNRNAYPRQRAAHRLGLYSSSDPLLGQRRHWALLVTIPNLVNLSPPIENWTRSV